MEAWTHGAGASAPILQNVTVPYGLLTVAGHGAVRLSTTDVTTTAVLPVTFSGLDLWVGGTACATWNVNFGTGRSSADFTVIGNGVAEGTGAITPTITSTGISSGTGTYTFPVSCSDSNGNASNTVNLTYTTVANACMLGPTDRVDFNTCPSTLGNSTNQKVWLPVGADYHNGGSNLCCTNVRSSWGTFTNQVTFEYADPSRPAYTPVFTTGGSTSTMSNYRVTGLILSGNLNSLGSPPISGYSCSSCSNIVFDHLKEESSIGLLGGASMNTSEIAFNENGPCAAVGGVPSCGVTDSSFNYFPSGLQPSSNTYSLRNDWRHYYNNAWFFNNVSDVDLEDNIILESNVAPIAVPIHPDSCQVGDGATPDHVTIKRLTYLQGSGSIIGQGCQFRGSLFGGGYPNALVTGYVDDGTSGHGPGTVLTLVTGVLESDSNGSLIVIPGSIAYTDQVRMNGAANATTATLTNLSPTVIGSPSSPVSIYAACTLCDWVEDGFLEATAVSTNWGSNGEAGTSVFEDFNLTQMNATPMFETTFTGSINASNVLSVASPPVSNNANELPCIAGCGRMHFSTGCTTYQACNYNPNALQSGTLNANGSTYSVLGSPGAQGSQTIFISPAYVQGTNVAGMTQGPWNNSSSSGPCTSQAMHTGTFLIKNGSSQAGLNQCTGITNTTLDPTFLSNTPVASDYASGMLPEAYMEANWSPAMTPEQGQVLLCKANKGRIGGAFDAGGGVTQGSGVTIETDAVHHTGGGNWMQNGVDSGIAITATVNGVTTRCSDAP